MSSSSLLSIIIIIIFITLLIMAICCQTKNNNVTFDCLPGERKALLRLKASFSDDPSNRLTSWEANSKCCTWVGVKCDNATGHVVKLDLRNVDVDEYGDFLSLDSSSLRSDTIDSSLLELKYLSYLDLSGNDFKGSSIPVFLGSMKQLEYLILFEANFSGIVPHQLGNLSNLRALGLGGEYEYLRFDDVTWAGHLLSLEYLYTSRVDLSGIEDVVYKVLNMLPSLVGLGLSDSILDDTNLLHAKCVNSTPLFNNVQYLDLSSNSFGENPSFCFLQNMTSLSFLDLSYNSIPQNGDWISNLMRDKCHLKSLNLSGNKFYGDISEALIKNLSGCWSQNLESINFMENEFKGHLPEELGRLKQLTEFDVSYNKLSGPIPSSIGNLKALRSLYLFFNQMGGEIPFSLGQLSNLEWIDISNNNFSGPIPHSLKNLKDFRVLNFSYNQLGGEIPSSLGQLSNLESFRLSGNNLRGPIPSSLGNLRALRELGLSHNLLGGEIPVSLGQLSNLESMGLYNNSFEGTLSEVHFANLSRLESLNVGLKFNVEDNWVPPFQLKRLKMKYNKIEGQFPQWLQTQKSLKELDLSNYSISGTFPAWLDSLMNLTSLDLSNNHVQGLIPQLPSSLNTLNLARNLINGSIPGSLLCQNKYLQNLDLSRNHLSGQLPDCNWGNLISVVFSSNQLSGPIPNSFGGDYCAFQWLQLNNNILTGPIPFTLKNCMSLSVLDVGDNQLSGKLPEWSENPISLRVLRVRNNKFGGDIPSAYCDLSQLQIMDLAQNQLTGSIPHCFGNLLGMINISQGLEIGLGSSSLKEVMKGVMLEYTSTLRFLVNLDLSSNHLFGEIPLELTNLIGLNDLNLSHNHLGGQIPQRIGDFNSLESLDLSDNNLFGDIPGSLSMLTSLSSLNFSNNDLSGPIPTGPQLQSLNDPSIYEGNPRLCGTPLVTKCHVIPVRSRKVENDDGNMKDKIYLYAFITCGLATGFWGYFGVLVLKRSWRLALFRYMDVVIGKLLGRY